MQVAIIDVGSNSIHLKVYEIHNQKHHTLLHQKVSGGLINYKENNMLNKDGIKQLTRILRDYKDICDLIGIAHIYCFATASLRNIANADKVVHHIKEKVGIDIDIISGYVESNLGFIGMQDQFHAKEGISIDMGGGSTEFLKFQNHEIDQVISIPFGCLSLYQYAVELVLPQPHEIKKIKRYVKKQISELSWLNTDVVYLSGGTAKSFARIHQELHGLETDINGYSLTKKEYNEFYDQILGDEPRTSKILTKLTPDRVHTVQPGMIAYKTIFQICQCEKIIISEAGVREGYLCKKILPTL